MTCSNSFLSYPPPSLSLRGGDVTCSNRSLPSGPHMAAAPSSLRAMASGKDRQGRNGA